MRPRRRRRPQETGSVFRSLFHDEGRRGAVAPVVSELWAGKHPARRRVPIVGAATRRFAKVRRLDPRPVRDAPADGRALFGGKA